MTILNDENSNLELCLRFTNTLNWRNSPHPEEALLTYNDLVQWAEKAGLISKVDAESLLKTAAEQPAEADRTLEKARALREVIYRIFEGVIVEETPAEKDLHAMNEALSKSMQNAYIVCSHGDFYWGWETKDTTLEKLLGPVVRSAGELLTSSEMRSRVGQCADDRGCGFLFLDTSKNKSRRWCNMGDCGNRAKQQRHYHRSQKKAS